MKKKEVLIILTMVVIVIGCFLLINIIKKQQTIVLMTYETTIKDNDYVFNAYKGLTNLGVGVTSKKVESLNSKFFKEKVNKQISRGADFIWTVEAASKEDMYELAKNNKDINFCVIDAQYNKKLNNLCSVYLNTNEASFLAGYLAGKKTQTNTVGFIGGKNEKVINEFEKYYTLGVKRANKDCEIFSDYANTYADKLMGENLAQAQYDDGADIIFTAAGVTGLGVISKAKTLGKWVIGVDTDQSSLAPHNMLASVTKDTNKAISYITKDYLNEKTVGGRNYEFGLKEGMTNIVITKNVDIETRKELNKLKKELISGKKTIEKTNKIF